MVLLFTALNDLLDPFRDLEYFPEPFFDFCARRSRRAMRSASSVPLTNVDLLFDSAFAIASFLFASAMMLLPFVFVLLVVVELEEEEEEEEEEE